MGWTVVVVAVLTVLSTADRPPIRWKASLSDPAETRWAHIQRAYADDIRTLAKQYTADISPTMQGVYARVMDLGFLDAELKIELQTLAKIANITYEEAAVLNLMYEYNAYCTSVIVQTSSGKIIHGRNLDYGYGSLLRKTLVEVDVYSNSTYQFTINWFPWYLGFNTGMRPGQYSLSLNQRDTGSWAENFAAMLMGLKGNFFQSRTALSYYYTYQSAKEFLTNADTVAASYDIIASNETGAIITRNRLTTERVIGLEEGGWYLVQTNHDWWTPDPVGDNRTAEAEAYLNKVGPTEFDEDQMFQLLSQFPVENPTTVFTTVMVPSTGYYKSVIRE